MFFFFSSFGGNTHWRWQCTSTLSLVLRVVHHQFNARPCVLCAVFSTVASRVCLRCLLCLRELYAEGARGVTFNIVALAGTTLKEKKRGKKKTPPSRKAASFPSLYRLVFVAARAVLV